MELFEHEEAVVRMDGNADLLKKIVAMFVDDAPTQIAMLRSGLEQGDFEQVSQVAHSLKGAASTAAAATVQAKAYEMETAAKERDLNTARSLLDELESEFLRFRTHLDEIAFLA